MSLSLIGIIFVQGYWIKTAIDNKNEQFSMNVNQILKKVSDELQVMEMRDFVDVLVKNDSVLNRNNGNKKPTISEISKLFVIQTDSRTNEKFIYSHGVLEEDYGVSSTFFENIGVDSINLKKLISKRESTIISEVPDENGNLKNTTESVVEIGQLKEFDKAIYETLYKDVAKRLPIYQRVSTKTVELLLQREFKDRNIDIDFEFGVYSNGLPTKIRSRNFRFLRGTRYITSLFPDNNGESDYDLMVLFPEKKKFLWSSILSVVLLSVVFTLVIIIAYSSALFQLIRQKRVSEMKTDFINNMTHEFKTPIATINLALDAIKRPISVNDQEKISRYLQMIKDENKRMHAQVENVLRISKLEKNQLDIKKEKVDIHDLIEDAITHVSLIVENRNGYIDVHLNADRSEVLGNNFHLTNVLVNILDNAVKYSPDEPKIDVYTEVVGNNIIVKIQDQGMGMTKVVLKKIFEKFYREHTGNIHNVKGHGLGLAYVKRIIEDHQGEVYADSEKAKGSTFYIKLPLII
ncbi:sensor histidine kinase [Abyssalbus ytuae]|uniref:histidine kinase n=1 Tax=Abyssalbus ytuae TaxID=2926907 RepID=A0A9E6ZVQ0_9FLAO|nr:HAMP domain-containing sensor histidine kinase [Abyssalbus ytuae]UOB17671.1 HAMP domain-containing histidine kinase [Abyssalbus ytuae]